MTFRFWGISMTSTRSPMSDAASVTYTNVASASPKATLLADALTFASRETMLFRTSCSKFSPYWALALARISLAYSAMGTPSCASTRVVPGFARSCSPRIPAGLSKGTITTGRFLAKVCGSEARSSSTAVFILASSAEAKTSAGAPCSSWVRSSVLPPKLMRTSVPGFCCSKVASSSSKASVRDEAASTVIAEPSDAASSCCPSSPPPHANKPGRSAATMAQDKSFALSDPIYAPTGAVSPCQKRLKDALWYRSVGPESLCKCTKFPQRALERRVRFRALIAGRCGSPRRSGRRRAAYRPMEWVASLCTPLPRNPLLGNRASDYRNSRKLSFRQTGFSETQRHIKEPRRRKPSPLEHVSNNTSLLDWPTRPRPRCSPDEQPCRRVRQASSQRARGHHPDTRMPR